MFNWLKKKQDDLPAWKKKVDNFANQLINENKTATRNLDEARQSAKKAEEDRIFAEFQAKFQCHVCHKPASQPTEEYVDQGMSCGYIETNWELPYDLVKCLWCGQWTCQGQECIYRGICRHCAEKL